MLTVAFVVFCSVPSVTTLPVPEDFQTIQSAIEAAGPGDTILVAPGIYEENIDFLGKAIRLVSSQGPASTVIDGNAQGTVVTISTGESVGTTLEGFTIRNGLADGNAGRPINGGGICCADSEAMIIDNIIEDNYACYRGGGIYGDLSQATIRSNLIRRNNAYLGGGVFASGNVHLIDNELSENEAWRGGGVLLEGYGGPLLISNKIHGNGAVNGGGIDIYNLDGVLLQENQVLSNYGGGVWIHLSTGVEIHGGTISNNLLGGGINGNSSEVSIFNTVVSANSTGWSVSGGINLTHCSCFLTNVAILANIGAAAFGAALFNADSNTVMRNTIVWGNEPLSEHLYVDGGFLEASYSAIEDGWLGEGNIPDNPALANPGSDEYHLRFGSPCIDAGLDFGDLPEFDIDGDPRVLGGSVDIGPDEFRSEIAIRYGYVNQVSQTVVTINGTGGDHERVVKVEAGDPVMVEIVPSSAGPNPARFVLYAWHEAPDETTFTHQLHNLGWTVFPTPLQGGANQPVETWNNLGRNGRLGFSTRESSLAPSTIASVPFVRLPYTFTLQGFIEDAGSRADGPVSITNAVILQVTD